MRVFKSSASLNQCQTHRGKRRNIYLCRRGDNVGGRQVFCTALSSAPRLHTRFLSTHPLLCISLLSYRRTSQGGLVLGRCLPPTQMLEERSVQEEGVYWPQPPLPCLLLARARRHSGWLRQGFQNWRMPGMEVILPMTGSSGMEVVRLLPMTGSCIISICKCLLHLFPYFIFFSPLILVSWCLTSRLSLSNTS